MHLTLGGCTNHPDEQPWLLSSTPDTGIANYSNGETSSETGKTDRETGTELNEPLEEGHLRGNCE